jgi:hypothetical protein
MFWGFWAQNTIKMKREVRRIHWYTAEKEKTNDTKVINNTISLGFQRQSYPGPEVFPSGFLTLWLPG